MFQKLALIKGVSKDDVVDLYEYTIRHLHENIEKVGSKRKKREPDGVKAPNKQQRHSEFNLHIGTFRMPTLVPTFIKQKFR